METTQNKRFELLVQVAAAKLATDGVRVITLASFYDKVMTEAARVAIFAPSWIALVDALERLEGFEVCRTGEYTLTLPVVEPKPRMRGDLLGAANRIVHAIELYKSKPVPGDHEYLLDWVLEHLGDSLPERKE